MNMKTMMLMTAGLAFAGGLTLGVTIESVVRLPEANVEAAVTSALLNFDRHRREQDRAEMEALKAEADEEFRRVMQGWGECKGCGATVPWDKGEGK
jgi:hypothetical protein